MDNEIRDYYKILGITPEASLENIRKARERELAQNWSNPMGRVEIERAYSILSNPESRREYDEKLKKELNEAELAKRNARTSSEFERANREFDFYVDPQQLEEEQSKESEKNIIVEEPTEVVEKKEEVVEEKEEATEKKEETLDEKDKSTHKKEEAEDIYSSSDHEIHNLLEEDNNKKVYDYIIPIQQKDKESSTSKEFTKLQKGLIYGGSLLLVGIPGPIIAYIAMKKLKGKKLKLHRNKHKKMTDIKTQESKLIEEYNQNLDTQINTLLAQPHNNYNLQIAKTRYENQIELLKKRIELKMNETVKRGGLTKYKLECVALHNQLRITQERLRTINLKINEYNKTEKNKNPILNKKNEELYELDSKIKKEEKNNRFSIKKLNIKRENLQKSRDSHARRLKITRNFVGKVQDDSIKVFDYIWNIKEYLTPYNKISYLDSKTTEQESAKTR